MSEEKKKPKTIWALRASHDSVQDGVRCEHTGAGFLLAYGGRGNSRHQPAWDTATKPYRQMLAHADEDQARKINEDIALEVFVNSMLLGWDGVPDEDGRPLEFNKENAKRVMRELTFLYDDLWQFAHNRANYVIGDPEADAKN